MASITTDPIDGTLTGASLQWTSDIDGNLGQGTAVTKVLSSASCGPTMHHVTLTGTDSKGNQASSTVIACVGPTC
ncbi:MAG: hypothetical protein WA476_04295 [Acidobacteriaceae bacterium]